MSIQNARKFYDKVVADAKLQTEVEGLRKANPKGGEAVISQIIELGKKNGFTFDAAEAKTMLADVAKSASNEDAELDDSQLAAVAGGKDESCACQWPYGSEVYVTA